jgi:ATP-dependent Lon protease
MLPENIKEGVKFYFVSDFQEVFKLLFPSTNTSQSSPVAPITATPQRA